MWGRALIGVLCCFVGALWIGQGTNLIHGSFMTGRATWAAFGAVLFALGCALLAWAWRSRPRRT